MPASEEILPDGTHIIQVALDGSPEEVAEALIADTLPEVFLHEVDLSGPTGWFVLSKVLFMRRYQASVEHDEIIAFVNRNRTYLEDGVLFEVVRTVADKAQDDELTSWIVDLVEQMRLVLDGRPEQVDVMSSRLLWLCLALDNLLHTGRLTFDDARLVLAKPEHAARMSSSAVGYLFADYLHHMDDLDSPRVPYIMVITECAVLAGLTSLQVVGAILLGSLPPPEDPTPWIEQRRGLRTSLRAANRWSDEMEQSLTRALSRFTEHIDDDDF